MSVILVVGRNEGGVFYDGVFLVDGGVFCQLLLGVVVLRV